MKFLCRWIAIFCLFSAYDYSRKFTLLDWRWWVAMVVAGITLNIYVELVAYSWRTK